MISMYCRRKHKTNILCQDCCNLSTYASHKIDKCPLGLHKTSCQDCKIHCYTPEMRDKIKKVMRFAGPRMLFLHPLIAIYHLLK